MASDSPTFNKSNADIVIRSSDNINFRLHKAILGEASPVFEGLIDLPLPPMPTDADDVYDGLPVVRLPEDSGTLERLFRIMYPTIDPIMETPDEISRVLTAASKYLMEGARAFCIKALMECKLLEREPLRVFAIACRFRLGAEARTSARQILSYKRLDLSRGTPPIELDDIPATVLFQLLDYVATCNEYADFVVHDETTWEVDFTRDLGFWCTTCGFTGSNAIVRKTRLHRKVGRYRELAYELLSKMPCASTELPELLTNTALMSLKWTEFGCSTCREKVIHALREFNTCLFRKINDGVYLLGIDLDF